jgi:hypothetical protein
VLLAAAPTAPLGLVADLLYALGWALWTGVVALFVQLLPEWKRRLILQRHLAVRAPGLQIGRGCIAVRPTAVSQVGHPYVSLQY